MTNNGIYLNDIPFDVFIDYYNKDTIENLEPLMKKSGTQYIQYNFSLNIYETDDNIKFEGLLLYNNIDLNSYLNSDLINIKNNQKEDSYYIIKELTIDSSKNWYILKYDNNEKLTSFKIENEELNNYLKSINNCEVEIYINNTNDIIIKLLSEEYYYQEINSNDEPLYIDSNGFKYTNINNNFERHQNATRKVIYNLDDKFYEKYLLEKNTIYLVNKNKDFIYKNDLDSIVSVSLNNGKLLSSVYNNNILTAYTNENLTEFYIKNYFNIKEVIKIKANKAYIKTDANKILIPLNNKIKLKIKNNQDESVEMESKIIYENKKFYIPIKATLKKYITFNKTNYLSIFYINDDNDEILLGKSKQSLNTNNKIKNISIKYVTVDYDFNFNITSIIDIEKGEEYLIKLKQKETNEDGINKINNNLYEIDKTISFDDNLSKLYNFPILYSNIHELDYQIDFIEDRLTEKKITSLKDGFVEILENKKLDLGNNRLLSSNYLLFYDYSIGLNVFMRNNILDNKIILKDTKLVDSISNTFIIENKNSVFKSNNISDDNNSNINDDRYILTRLAQYEKYPLSKDYIKYLSSISNVEINTNTKIINNVNMNVENKKIIQNFDTMSIYKEKLLMYLFTYYQHGNDITPNQFYENKIKGIFEDCKKEFSYIPLNNKSTNKIQLIHDGSDLQETINKLKSGEWRIYDN